MQKKFLFFVITFLSLIILQNSYAWDATGHKIIAAIAYDNLTPETKAKVDQLTCIFDKNNHDGFCNNSENAKKTRFMFDATWADLLRSENIPDFDDWHFIDNPNNSTQPKNVVWALNESKKVLSKWQYDIYEKAIFFRFLLHFVGDAHQPMHCVNHNDRGGNLVPINSKYADNLHEYWDRGLGEFCSRFSYEDQTNCSPLSKKELNQLINYIEYRYPKNYFDSKIYDLNPKNWAIESNLIANNFAYQLTANSKPSYKYDKIGRKIALEQIALAGFRLANLLNNIEINLAAASSKPLTEIEAIEEVKNIEK
jgi:hypothetical protein